jgi:hypothetical protein
MLPTYQARLLPISAKLQTRLDIIVDTIQNFWNDCPHYQHYTRQGSSHSWRVYQNLTQLIKGFSASLRLTDDELFISSATAWLYEIGMQCPNPALILQLDENPNITQQQQLEVIRVNKHKLTHQMILQSISEKKENLSFGLLPDAYTKLIAETCSWISYIPIEKIPDVSPLYGTPVRISLLVALLRLADQLYIDHSRLNVGVLRSSSLSPKEKIRLYLYFYTEILPIDEGQIRFFYSIPLKLKEHIGKVRTLLETEFDYSRNPTIRYLWDKYSISLIPNDKPKLSLTQQEHNFSIEPELINLLIHEIAPIESYNNRGLPGKIYKLRLGIKIFLSYAPHDILQVKDLHQRLRDNGFLPWMDTDLLPGEQREFAIRSAILDSDFFLVCLSHQSVGKRGRLQKEIRIALDICQGFLDEDIYLIPVRFDDCDVPEKLKAFQWVDLFINGGWENLVKAIQRGAESRISAGSGCKKQE